MSQPTAIHLIYGPQGAGKTTYARTLAAQTQGLRVSIDDWMVTLYGPDLPQPPDLTWVLARLERCHDQIWSLTQRLVQLGTPVILDLGLLTADDRRRAQQRAEQCGAPATMHFVDAPHDIRRQRVLNRTATQGDTFALAVTPAMFDFMETLYQPPGPEEQAASQQLRTHD